jgi:hypothetical protein
VPLPIEARTPDKLAQANGRFLVPAVHPQRSHLPLLGSTTSQEAHSMDFICVESQFLVN